MNDGLVLVAAACSAFAAVVAWFAGLRTAGHDRVRLVLIAVLAVVTLALSVIVNDISVKLTDVRNVRQNQNCIIALLRTASTSTVTGGVVEAAPVTDAELHARFCPAPPPFPR